MLNNGNLFSNILVNEEYTNQAMGHDVKGGKFVGFRAERGAMVVLQSRKLIARLPISILSESYGRIHNTFTFDPLLTTEIIAEHYSCVSFNSHYDGTLSYKLRTENSQISFDISPGEPHPYNFPTTEK